MAATNRTKLYLLVGVMMSLLAVNLGPWFWGLYQAKKARVEQLQARLFFQQKLRNRADGIIKRFHEIPKLEKEYREKLFQGETPEIVSSLMRTELNNMAQRHNISIQSMGLPKFSIAGDWVLITQSLTFIVPQARLLGFFEELERSRFFLPIISLDIRVAEQDTIRCAMKIVGFSRLTGEKAAVYR